MFRSRSKWKTGVPSSPVYEKPKDKCPGFYRLTCEQAYSVWVDYVEVASLTDWLQVEVLASDDKESLGLIFELISMLLT
jgi:hypothetical protein